MVKGDQLSLVEACKNLATNALRHGAPPIVIAVRVEGRNGGAGGAGRGRWHARRAMGRRRHPLCRAGLRSRRPRSALACRSSTPSRAPITARCHLAGQPAAGSRRASTIPSAAGACHEALPCLCLSSSCCASASRRRQPRTRSDPANTARRCRRHGFWCAAPPTSRCLIRCLRCLPRPIPDLRITYEQWGSNDLYDIAVAACAGEAASADLVDQFLGRSAGQTGQ